MTGPDHRGDRPGWAPDDVDISRPSIARVYDYFLGGSHNFPADREAARRTLEEFPEVRASAYVNRAFLRRVVRYLVARGVRQFLDIGSGIPTVGNVHQTAQAIDPRCRVLYVDIDPVAVTHSRAILANTPYTGVVHADIREPERIFGDRETARVLDLEQPLGLLMFLVLHFVPDSDDPVGLLGRYRDAMAPGSYLAITHATLDEFPGDERFASWKATYDRRVARTTTRSKAGIEALFDGFEMVAPGLVWPSWWRPDPGEEYVPAPGYGGVAYRA